MKNFLNYIYRNSTLIYKSVIFISALLLILYFFLQLGQFRYDFTKNKVWQYNDLVAPFDFTIKKSKASIGREKDSILKNTPVTFEKKTLNTDSITAQIDLQIRQSDLAPQTKAKLIRANHFLIPKIYKKGLVSHLPKAYRLPKVIVVNHNVLKEMPVQNILTKSQLNAFISKYYDGTNGDLDFLSRLYKDQLPANLIENNTYQKELIQHKLAHISLNKGFIQKGQIIIKKGEKIDAAKYEILNSLKRASGFYPENPYQKYWIYLGYGILISMVLLLLMLFLHQYRPEIYHNNIKLSLIIFNMILMIVLTTVTVKYYPAYVFVVPLVILPLILKAFFDARVALFVHVLTVLLLGFVVSNSFEFIFLQIMAGIVSVLTVSELTKRANLFTSVGNILLVYIIGYLAFHLIYEGNIGSIDYKVLWYFLINGVLAIALSHQLILIYEKLFGLVSDVSLLEWSNTNSKLLKRLADKAPGTFNHSMQVANLAESAANAINANSLLVRAGALYHDIGKMLNPFYFTENQTSGVNYHDDLAPEDSARIIIQHVLDGVELARKNNLPDRLIDFIRTHHGRGLVQYFYKKALEENPEVDKEKFRYPGPNPFSKETAILMMADSVEAASKSLREPTAEKIDNFVDKIIDHQLHSGLLDNANITLKEISTIKKLFKKKLKNIYHLRIEYPE